ncbi:hypothetical protein [Sinomonas albida]|uniref:hypothetical protein n=1 Tax=Sinomonas albida TaxID=369942 RepID=UPI00301854D4
MTDGDGVAPSAQLESSFCRVRHDRLPGGFAVDGAEGNLQLFVFLLPDCEFPVVNPLKSVRCDVEWIHRGQAVVPDIPEPDFPPIRGVVDCGQVDCGQDVA